MNSAPNPTPTSSSRSTHPGTLALLLLGGCLLLLLAGGCATGTRKSNPLWDAAEQVPSEAAQERVNLWPLLYWQDPSLSILWPLYTRTDAGHALVPFYEWTHDDRRLRVGTVHPDMMPVLADFDGGRDRWRFLNVVHDREKKRFRIIPLYYENYSANNPSRLILPVYYGDDRGYWTPLITRRDDIQGVLGPLFHRREGRDGATWAAPWPIVSARFGDTSGEVRAFPVYRHQWRPQWERRHVAWILYRYDRDSKEERHALLWPLAQKWDSDEESGRYVFPFFYQRHGEQSGTTNILGPVYHRTYTEDRQSTHFLWPLGQVTSTEASRENRLFPFYYTKLDHTNGVRTVHTPLTSWRDDGSLRNVGLILFHTEVEDDQRYSSLLWPLTHHWSGPDEAGGSSVLPFYYHRTDGDKNRLLVTPIGGALENPEHSFRTVLGPVYFRHDNHESGRQSNHFLWPLGRVSSDETTRRSYLLPFYYTEVDQAENVRSVYTPLASWRDDGSLTNFGLILYHAQDNDGRRYSSVLWPAAHRWSKPDGTRGSSVFPFYYHSTDGDKNRLLVTPIGGAFENPESTFRTVLGPVYIGYRDHESGRQSDHFLWPLGQVSSDETTRRSYLLPFYYTEVDQTEGVRSVYTPLASWRDDGSFRNFGLFLYHMREKDDRRYSSLLWPLTHRWSGPDETGGSTVLPFYYHNTDNHGNRSFLTPAGGRFETPTHRYRTFLGPIYYDVREKEAEREYQTVAWPFWHRTTTPDSDRQVLLPLYYRRQTEDHSTFISLPYTRRSGPEMRSQSALLGLVGWGHDESRGHRHHRVLPFYTRSHSSTKKETRLFGGLGGWSHDPVNDRKSHHLFPFYSSHQSLERRNLSLGRTIIYTGTHHRLTPDELKDDFVASLPQGTKDSTNQNADEVKPHPPIGRRFSLSNREWLLSWINSTRSLVATAEHLAQNGDQPNSREWQIAFEEHTQARWWPFYHREQKGDREARREVLWRLYDSRTIAPDEDNRYSRRRVLWRVWHQEQRNSHVSTDFFPFVSVDRNREEELFRWSFAGGLLGVHRQGEERRFRLLYFRLGGKTTD